MILASHSHPSLILSQLPHYIHLLSSASVLTSSSNLPSTPTNHTMSSPDVIIRQILRGYYDSLSHNEMFKRGALSPLDIAAEYPKRYRREVLLIGLLN